jgi:hypothetical protein
VIFLFAVLCRKFLELFSSDCFSFWVSAQGRHLFLKISPFALLSACVFLDPLGEILKNVIQPSALRMRKERVHVLFQQLRKLLLDDRIISKIKRSSPRQALGKAGIERQRGESASHGQHDPDFVKLHFRLFKQASLL